MLRRIEEELNGLWFYLTILTTVGTARDWLRAPVDLFCWLIQLPFEGE